MGGGGSDGGGDQTQTTVPWGPQGKELKYGFKQARGLYNGPEFSMYQGQTFANPNADIQQAWDTSRNLATGLNSAQTANTMLNSQINAPDRQSFVDPAARQYMQSATNGDYLNSNPYLDAMSDMISKKTMAQANNAFAGSGRTQSGAQARGVTSALADANTMLYGNNYARERGMQQQAAGQLAGLGAMDQQLSDSDINNRFRAAGMAPMAQQAQFGNAQMLGQIGGAQQAYDQAGIDENIARHNFSQEEPWQRLERYMGIVGSGNPGSTTTASGGGGGGGGFSAGGAIGGGLAGMGMMGGLGAGGLAAMGPMGWGVAGLGALAGSGLLG